MERRSIAEWERELGVQYQTLVYLARRAKIYPGKPRGSGAVLLTREQAESLVPRAQALEALREHDDRDACAAHERDYTFLRQAVVPRMATEWEALQVSLRPYRAASRHSRDGVP